MGKSQGISRRNFVTAAGIASVAAAGGLLAGCSSDTDSGSPQTEATATPTNDGDIAWADEADIIVVGAGAAGWGATYEATKAGASVIVLEKNATVGGDMAVCAGLLPGYDTPYTKEHGVTATGKECFDEYVARGENPHGLPPQDVIEYVFENCGDNIDILADAGVEWERAATQAHYSQYDIFFEAHSGDIVGGGAFIEPITKIIEESGANLITEMRGKKLILDADGRVIGITAQQGDEDVNYKANKAVILTTGGYSANSKLIGAFAEQWQGVAGCGRPTTLGDGLLMATELGALTTRTQDGGFILCNSEYGTGANVNADLLYKGFICDQEGNRCINDGASYATNDLVDQFEAQFARQPEDYLWLVVDSSEDTLADLEVNNSTHGTKFIEGDTLDALAAEMGVDSANLTAAATSFSSHAGELTDPEFGERSSGYPIHAVQTGPFYALKVGPSIVMTTGGLKASMTCEVLRTKSAGVTDDVAPEDDTTILEAIPGLYAAGMIAEWTCFTGWSCTSCITLGRLAGKTAAGA